MFHSLSEAYEQKRKEHFKVMQSKEEHMRQMFVQKVSTVTMEILLPWKYCYHGNTVTMEILLPWDL